MPSVYTFNLFYEQTSERKTNKSQDMWRKTVAAAAAALQHAGRCVWPIKPMCVCSSSKNTQHRHQDRLQSGQITHTKKNYKTRYLTHRRREGETGDCWRQRDKKKCWLDRQQHDRYWDNGADFVSGALPSVDLTHAGRAESLVIRSSSPPPLYPGSHWTVNQYGLSPNAGHQPDPIYQAPDSFLQPWAQTNCSGRARAATTDGAENRAKHPHKWRDTGYVRGRGCQNTQLHPEDVP